MISPKKSLAISELFNSLVNETIQDDFSKQFVEKFLAKSNFQLDDRDIQFLLEDLHRRGFIDLKKQDDVYLRVLLRGIPLIMMRLLALLWRIYDDGGKVTYSKAAIASYMRSSRIEHDIDDAEVQSVFQKWHEDGKIEFIRQDDLYLMLLVPKRG